MQTRSGKTYTNSAAEKNKAKVDINIDNRANNTCDYGLQPKRRIISNELARFMGKPAGSEMRFTEVVLYIRHYINNNNLANPTNGRIINPDKKLATLLKLNKNDELTQFNFSRYLKQHLL
jgi:chromatin remodeling complex protein RSC6